VVALIVAPNSNSMSFFILGTLDVKYLVGLPVDELFILILKDLPPSGVSAPDLHVVSSSAALNVPRLVVVSGSNGQGLLMEVPHLSLSTVWCLDDHVSVVNQIKVSTIWKLRDNVEISFDIQTEFLIHLTLGWFSLILIDIDNSPPLVNLVVSLLNDEILVLIIDSSRNSNDLALLVGDVSIFVPEHLPPS
jgi:hypothetical protein